VSRGFKIGVAVFLILFLMLLVLPGFPWLLECLGYFLIGWASFIRRVLPKIQVNWSGVGLLLPLLALIAGLGHSFCSWLWRGSGRQEPWKFRWTTSGIGVIVLMFAAGMAFTGIVHQTGWLLNSPEPLVINGMSYHNATSSLKMIASVQEYYRSNDADGNGKNDYWRADIAGLYALKGRDGKPLKLIELSIAAADDRPKVDLRPYADFRPKGGYQYRALQFLSESIPDPNRFAVCAYPIAVSGPPYTFIIDQHNVIYRKIRVGEPLMEVFPEDPKKEGWQPLD